MSIFALIVRGSGLDGVRGEWTVLIIRIIEQATERVVLNVVLVLATRAITRPVCVLDVRMLKLSR